MTEEVIVPIPEARPLPIQPFECWAAAVALYAGLSRFLPLPATGPARAVEMALPDLLVMAWNALYAAGGLLIIIGLVRRSPRLEAAGLHLLGSGLLVAGIAILMVGAPVLPTIVVQGGAIVACICRLRIIT